MTRSVISPMRAVVVVLAGVCLVVLLSVSASRLNVLDQAKGALDISASCDDLKFSELQRDFPKKSRGLGLAFKPYAEGLENCGTLTGKERRFVRSLFGPHFDSDSRADSWAIGTRLGLIDRSRSMAVFYSDDGVVTGVELSAWAPRSRDGGRLSSGEDSAEEQQESGWDEEHSQDGHE